jgi:hypothetical protein
MTALLLTQARAFVSRAATQETALISEMMSSKRLHPPEGHLWYTPKAPRVGNLKFCKTTLKHAAADKQNTDCHARRFEGAHARRRQRRF